jgi:hypothetical protein
LFKIKMSAEIEEEVTDWSQYDGMWYPMWDKKLKLYYKIMERGNGKYRI